MRYDIGMASPLKRNEKGEPSKGLESPSKRQARDGPNRESEKTLLTMGGSRQTFEKYWKEWYFEVLILKSLTLETDKEDTLRDAFLQNVDPEVVEALKARLVR